MPSIRTISVSGSIPSITQLALGDLAVNTYDGKAYLKKQQGTTQTVVEIGSGGGGAAGVTQIIAGTNITISPVGGTGAVTINASSTAVSASYALNASYAATASVNPLQSSLLTNQTVGGVTSGTTFPLGTPVETILRSILITYIAPTLGTINLLNGGSTVLNSNTIREVGNSLIFNTASFTATADNPNGRFPYSSSFTASGADSGNFNYFFGNDVLTTSNNRGLGGSQTINVTSISSGYSKVVTFDINGRNPETGGIISATDRTLTYIYPIFYGMNATDYSTTGNISGSVGAGITKLLQTRGNKTLTISGTSAYIYFAYPTLYGDLISIKDGNNFEILDTFNKYTRTQNGDTWTGISYNIYRSPTLTTVNPSQPFIFTF